MNDLFGLVLGHRYRVSVQFHGEFEGELKDIYIDTAKFKFDRRYGFFYIGPCMNLVASQVLDIQDLSAAVQEAAFEKEEMPRAI
jgi:hypothetical protein